MKGIKWGALTLLLLVGLTTIFMNVAVVQKERDNEKEMMY